MHRYPQNPRGLLIDPTKKRDKRWSQNSQGTQSTPTLQANPVYTATTC